MTDYPRGSSEWWLDRLGSRMTARATEMQRYADYYSGKQGQRFIGTKYRELFAKFFENYAENFCGIVVDSVSERLEVQGFRYPKPDGTLGKPEEADRDAWRIWQDNQLDAASQIAHTESLVKGVSYVLVSPFPAEYIADRSPRITIEDACDTIVEFRAGSTERLVGMKRWLDLESETYFATLYFPDRVEKWKADKATVTVWANQYGRKTFDKIQWVHRETTDEPWPLVHDLGVVPLVPLVNRPRMSGEGESELAKVIPLQDAINTISMNGIVASESAAFPQKWASGIEIPTGEDGKPVAPWKPDIERILSSPVPDAKFGTFLPADLSQWSGEVDSKIKHIAAITQTPYHYFLDHGGQPPSGDSIKSSETGLVRKTGAKQLHMGEGWEEVERLAFKVLGDPRAEVLDAETIWAPAETMSEAEHVDALVKMASLGVPDEVLWEKWGASPQEIERWKTIQAQDALLRPEPLPSLKPLAPTQTSPLPTTDIPVNQGGGRAVA